MTLNLIFTSFLISVLAFAAHKPLEISELIPRLEIKGEIFVLDPTGKRILFQQNESKSWRIRGDKGRIENHWSSETEDYLVAFHHIWEVQPDGSIRALIEQYGKIERDNKSDPNFTNLIKKQELILENFDPISWIVTEDKRRRVVARFTPRMRADDTPKSLSDLPISGTDIMVTDNKGFVWAENADVDAKYVGLITSRGALFLSYYPFQGATELGSASDNKIEINLDKKHEVTITSEIPFLPKGVHARVYGMYKPEKQTARLSSLHTVTSNHEDRFQQSLKKALSDPRYKR